MRTRPIAVAGATGRLGRHLVELLGARGRDVSRISRADGVDLLTGDGLAEALAGAGCVIDASNAPSSDEETARRFFTTVAANLQAAGARAGVRRIVVVSIIGCDRFSAGYYAAKQAHEQAARAGPVSVQVIRAAQFHELVESVLASSRRDGVAHVRKLRTQPLAARVAASAMVDLALASEQQLARIFEVAGPRPEWMAELVRLLAEQREEPLAVQEVSDPADPDRELYETGALLPGPSAKLVGPTFAEWLNA
jgi:uncharacterized protein YbjT (DUF2867 family)